MSYKQIAETLATTYDVPEPSKQSIYAWVKKYTADAVKEMADHPAQTGPEWVADEMMVERGREEDVELECDGRQDPPTFWRRTYRPGGTRMPLLGRYARRRGSPRTPPSASARTSWVRTRRPSSGCSRKPSTSSRRGSPPRSTTTYPSDCKGRSRQRTKTLRGLETRLTGQRFLDGWVVTYNLFRDHEGADGNPPAVKAGVKPPFEEWADVVRKPVAAGRNGTATRGTPALRRAKTRRGSASAGRIASAQPKRTKRG